MTVPYRRTFGRSIGHAGIVRRGHAYRGDLAHNNRSRPARPLRRTLRARPRLAGALTRLPHAAAILVAAVLAIDLLNIVLLQQAG